MASLQLITITLALLVGSAFATWGYGGSTLPEGAALGDPCTPSGTPLKCGERILLDSEEANLTAADGVEGPNVCEVTSMYMQQTYNYTYQEKCSRYRRRQFCYTGCFPTTACNGSIVEFNKTKVQCCDGFAQEEGLESSSSSHWFFKKRRNSLRTEGCPVMLEENVLDCLVELNMLEFLAEVLQVAGVEERLRNGDSDPVTIFAPSDEALRNLNDITRNLLFGDLARETTVSAHIVEGTFTTKKLNHGRFINTLAPNVTVHIGRISTRTVKNYTVNGVQISQRTACQARNGIVHIIDDVIPFSTDTIDDILRGQSSRFSTYRELADAAGIAELLALPQKSRTLFAPNNDAFDPRFVDCLLEDENERYLEEFVLIHISSPAEYTSTLSLCRYIPTFTYWYLTIGTDGDQVTVTRDAIPITDPDIPARNGVIHEIPSIIQPFSDNKLERICPGITLPTTAPATTAPEGEVTPDPDGVPEVDPEEIPDPGVAPGGV